MGSLFGWTVPTTSSDDDEDTQTQQSGGMASGAWSTVSGVGDWAAGSSDESFARSFDSTKGGGMWTGLNQSTKAASDTVLDNSVLSIQNAVQAPMTEAAEFGVWARTGNRNTEVSPEELSEGFAQGAQQTKQWWDKNAKNPLTSNVVSKFGGAVAADTAKTFMEAGTGIDIDKPGETSADLNVAEASEIALSGAGVKAGKTALSAVRQGDEAGSIVASALNRGTAADETADAATDADDGVQFGDAWPNTGGSTSSETSNFTDLHGGDEITVSDDAPSSPATVADEEADTAEDIFNVRKTEEPDASSTDLDMTRDTGRSAAKASEDGRWRGVEPGDANQSGTIIDDAMESSNRAENADDGGLLSRFTRSSDEGDDAGDAARTAEDADDTGLGERARQGLFGNKRRAAITTTGAAVGAASLEKYINNNNSIPMADGSRLERVDSLPPNSKAPDGASAWQVIDAKGNPAGYTAILGVRGNQVLILGSDGQPQPSKVAQEAWQKAMERGNPSRGQGGGSR